jgi:ribosome maturation factor RimP
VNYEEQRQREEVVEKIRARCGDLCRQCGLEFSLVMVVGYGEDLVLEIEYGGSLSFDVLEKLSRALGTRLIDITSDNGTSSDPWHEKWIVVRKSHLAEECR